MLLFCPLCSLCFKGTSKEWARGSRRTGRGRTHKEKCCPQWLFSALQGRYKNWTKQSTPDAKEGRSEQKKFFIRRRKGKKGEAEEKGKGVKAGFKVRGQAVLREWRRVFKRGLKHSRKDKRAFYTTPRRNKNRARRKAQTRARVPQSGDKGWEKKTKERGKASEKRKRTDAP